MGAVLKRRESRAREDTEVVEPPKRSSDEGVDLAETDKLLDEIDEILEADETVEEDEATRQARKLALRLTRLQASGCGSCWG